MRSSPWQRECAASKIESFTEHKTTHFRGLKERERERCRLKYGKSLQGVCVSLSALSLITAQFLPFYFIWRIYGDFYHKYFACFHFILIFLLLLLVCLFFPWGVSSKEFTLKQERSEKYIEWWLWCSWYISNTYKYMCV